MDGCVGPAAGRGLCDKHYKRMRKRGTTDATTTRSRFDAKYAVDPDGCWVWTDAARAGYGFLLVNGKKQMAHRVSYELHVGPIPEGLQIDHLCRNKLCVNPTHLEPVTQRENILRSDNMAARWARRTECHVCGGELKWRGDRRYCVECERRRGRNRKR